MFKIAFSITFLTLLLAADALWLTVGEEDSAKTPFQKGQRTGEMIRGDSWIGSVVAWILIAITVFAVVIVVKAVIKVAVDASKPKTY
jgi:hypothetical protein